MTLFKKALTEDTNYAKAGDTVEIYNTEHGDVYLCRTESGNCFPAHKNKFAGEQKETIAAGWKKQAKKKPQTQTNQLTLL